MADKDKTEVIEQLFDGRWDPTTQRPMPTVVTLDDVARAIRSLNEKRGRQALSDRNPANFFKDFVRVKRRANNNWPRSVLARGYTGRQVTGAGASFEFVRLAPDQREPFPEGVIPEPTDRTPTHRIQSASLPMASRLLGRSDESWLAQVAVRLHLVETHLALFSQRSFIQVDHLQMGVKLRRSEIDALYLGIESAPSGETREVTITCEVKGRRDSILEDQVLSQARAVFGLKGVLQNSVLPLAMKAIGPSRVWIVRYDEISRSQAPNVHSLSVGSEAIYDFNPPIPGIGG